MRMRATLCACAHTYVRVRKIRRLEFELKVSYYFFALPVFESLMFVRLRCPTVSLNLNLPLSGFPVHNTLILVLRLVIFG